MTEVTSRRGMILAAAGLGVVGLETALIEPSEAVAGAVQIAVPPASVAVDAFRLAVPDAVLSDLRTRLAASRWPDKETVGDWSQGLPLADMKAFTDYCWRSRM